MTNVQNSALNRAAYGPGLAASVTHLSLHTSDGGSNGDDELSGGDYEPQEPDYGSASGGVADLNETVEFDGPSSTEQVTHLGFWDGSTWLGSAPLDNPRPFGQGDTLRISSAPVMAEPRDS